MINLPSVLDALLARGFEPEEGLDASRFLVIDDMELCIRLLEASEGVDFEDRWLWPMLLVKEEARRSSSDKLRTALPSGYKMGLDNLITWSRRYLTDRLQNDIASQWPGVRAEIVADHLVDMSYLALTESRTPGRLFEDMLAAYSMGVLPCGWDGSKYPEGKLVVQKQARG